MAVRAMAEPVPLGEPGVSFARGENLSFVEEPWAPPMSSAPASGMMFEVERVGGSAVLEELRTTIVATRSVAAAAAARRRRRRRTTASATAAAAMAAAVKPRPRPRPSCEGTAEDDPCEKASAALT